MILHFRFHETENPCGQFSRINPNSKIRTQQKGGKEKKMENTPLEELAAVVLGK